MVEQGTTKLPEFYTGLIYADNVCNRLTKPASFNYT